GAFALLDLEYELLSTIALRDRLRRDLGGEAAAMVIGIEQPLDVVVDQRTRQRAIFLRLHERRHLRIVQLLVALEDDSRADRMFVDLDRDDAAVAMERDLGDLAAAIHRLQRGIEIGIGQTTAAGLVEVGLDAIDAESMVALDRNRGFARCGQ